MAPGSGPRHGVLLLLLPALKSLALSTPPAPPALSLSRKPPCLALSLLAMALVPQRLALAMALVPQSLAPVLKSLARKPRPPTDLFCWTLLPSTAFAWRPETSGAVMVYCTQKPGKN